MKLIKPQRTKYNYKKKKKIKEKSRTPSSRWRNARAMIYPMGIACLAPVRQVIAAWSQPWLSTIVPSYAYRGSCICRIIQYLPLSTCTGILYLLGKCVADHNLDYLSLSTCMHWGLSCSCGTSLKLITTLITYRCPLTLVSVLQLSDKSVADHNLDYLPLSTCTGVLQLWDKCISDHNLDYLPLSPHFGTFGYMHALVPVLQLSVNCIADHSLSYLPLSPHMDTWILWVLQLSEKSAADHNLDYLPLSPHFGTVGLKQLSDDSVTHHNLDYLPQSTCMHWCLSCICRSSL